MTNLTAIKIKDLAKGEFFIRKPEANKVYVRDGYCASSKKYIGGDWTDISRECLLKGDTVVYTGFDF